MRIDGLDWDEGNWPKCGKHGVEKDEIEFVLSRDPLILPDRSGALETRYNAVGTNQYQRYIFIVFCVRRRGSSNLIRPISARYMHEKEVRTYDRTREA